MMDILCAKKKSLVVILLILSCTVTISSNPFLISEEYMQINSEIDNDTLNNQPKFYTTIERLVIDSDEDFITFGFPGNGTIESPYLIDSYIVRSGFNESSLFYITNVTKHFIIQNCQTEHIDGIVLEGLNTGSAVLRSNQIMRIDLFYPAMIKNCFSIIDCSNIIIANNTCDSNVNGIIISKSRNVTVANNTILNGINESSSDRRYCGLSITSSENCHVYNNNFEEGGIFIDVSEQEIDSILFENNTILRWKSELYKTIKTSILILRNISDISLDASLYGQILAIKCKNVTFENMLFNNSFIGCTVFFSNNCKVENGLANLCQIGFMDFHSSNTKFKNITCIGTVRGTQLISSENCLIDGLTSIKSSSYEGLYIAEKTKNTLVKNSNCSYNGWSTGVQDSGLNTTFINNYFEYNYIGVSLWSSTNSSLMWNQINHNKNQGIFLSGTKNILLFENSLSFNRNYGIYATNSELGTISTNLIFGNEGYGIYLSSSTQDFVIYRNSFINNEPLIGTSQAFDSGTKNLWYHPDIKIGNYWSGRGSKKTYEIDGEAESLDLFPLKDPIYYPPESYTWKASFSIFFGLFVIVISSKVYSIKRKNSK